MRAAAPQTSMEPPENTPLDSGSTALPRPAVPLAVVASSALLFALTGAAAAQRSPGLALYLALSAIAPWIPSGPRIRRPNSRMKSALLAPLLPRERLRSLSVFFAYAGIGWCLFQIVRVPAGARITTVLLPSCVVLAARVWALRTEGALRWAHPRWSSGALTSAPPLDLKEVLEAALSRTPAPPEAIDRAVAALAAASPAAIPSGEAERRAFWMNTYNVLTAHAERGLRSERRLDTLEVLRTSYLIAGVRLTPGDIKQGLLRRGSFI